MFCKNTAKMKNDKVKIVIALGSNVNQVENISIAKILLEKTFENMVFGRETWTDPIGLPESDRFLNVIGVGYTCVGRPLVEMALKSIERKCGRRKSLSSRGIIPVDLDLLLFDTERYHADDWQRPYMKMLLHQFGIE